MINTRLIKERMEQLGLTQTNVAEALGVAQPTASQKINGIRPIDLDEAKKLADVLRITDADYGAYFFSM